MRFLGALLAVNVLVVPVVVWALTRPLAGDEALLVGAVLVLLAPCVDYVMVFTRLAGGDAARLLAASPLLMGAQMVMIPVLLPVLTGVGVASGPAGLAPFARAFVLLIALPLLGAVLTQLAAARGSRAAHALERAANAAMVPLMMLVLGLVVASQFRLVAGEVARLAALLPVYVAFVLVMVPLGVLAGSLARQDGAGRRALALSAATRNSLVVLPLALAMPGPWALAPAVVVTQTLVELLAMVCLVRLLPRFVRDPSVLRRT